MASRVFDQYVYEAMQHFLRRRRSAADRSGLRADAGDSAARQSPWSRSCPILDPVTKDFFDPPLHETGGLRAQCGFVRPNQAAFSYRKVTILFFNDLHLSSKLRGPVRSGRSRLPAR